MSASRGLGHIAVIPHEAVDYYGEDFGLNPVGSGPFEFVEYSPDEHVILQRNKDYWKEPYLDEVIYRVIPDEDAALIAFEAGEIDTLGSVPKDDIEGAAKVLGSKFQEMVKEVGMETPDLKYENCPACGTQVAEDVEECPECGLFVGKG